VYLLGQGISNCILNSCRQFAVIKTRGNNSVATLLLPLIKTPGDQHAVINTPRLGLPLAQSGKLL
jgi:hypothetical protein